MDPSFHQIDLTKPGKVILIDTVGFIRDFPHELLIFVFHAMFKETRQADLLLHVIDSRSPASLDTIDEVQKVLEAIETEDTPQLYGYNKIDLQEGVVPQIDYDEKIKPCRMWLSALTELGLYLLD